MLLNFLQGTPRLSQENYLAQKVSRAEAKQPRFPRIPLYG